jgi:hypothetical protein
MPRFYGGTVGYLGYDMVFYFEKLQEAGTMICDLMKLFLLSVIPSN